MKDLINKIYPVILVGLLILAEIFLYDERIFGLFFSIGAFLLLAFVLLQYSFNRKTIRIKWLKNKLEQTEEILRQKKRVEENLVEKMPVGIIIYNEKYEVTWSNEYAKHIFENVLEKRIIETLNKSIYQALIDHDDSFKFVTDIYRNKYEIDVDIKNRSIYLTLVTEREINKQKMDASIPAIVKLNFDNFEDAMTELDISKRTLVQAKYYEVMETWADEYGFYITPTTSSRLVAVMKKESLQALIKNEFKIIEEINAISQEHNVMVTLSAGIACSDLTYETLGEIAEDALDLALNRGGNQIVVNLEKHELMFFGGTTNAAEKRTKITTRTSLRKLEQL